MRFYALFFSLVLTGCQSQQYFIVRHAEKAVISPEPGKMMESNPPLSEAGKVRAFVLRDELKGQNIRHIFSTNTLRTISTAQPLQEQNKIQSIGLYSSSRDSMDAFIVKIKSITKGNVLVVGHSNTVDDLVNKLTGRNDVPGDLQDAEYDNLFIVTKKGKKMLFERKKYGYPSNPETGK
ncbi:MAG TPA: phosphoglycerate mutase family protein [Chitinophagaceae bacterium]|nr:phosphoglycerate mutase family protein [Chitinophagaceae bacterium]